METVADRIIDALGGTTAVSRKTDTPPSTVHSWRKNGIPRSRLSHLKLVAAHEGVSIDWSTGLRLSGEGGTFGHVAPGTIREVALS
ncbi:carph-isopro domain-containing protein [Sphingomonas koreensis]